MIRLQNVSQLAVFNFTQQAALQRNASINNNLERSPQCDSISFTGKIKKEEPEEILPIIDLDAEDIVEVGKADFISDEDSAYIYNLEDQEGRLREEEAEEDRRRREEDDLNNDMLLYGAVLPAMIIGAEDISVVDDTTNTYDSLDDIVSNNDDFYFQNNDFSSFDDGLNDFNDYGF